MFGGNAGGWLVQLAMINGAKLPKGLWKTKDVAKYLGVHEKHVPKLRKEEGLPWIRAGGSVRFDPEAVASWAKARQEDR